MGWMGPASTDLLIALIVLRWQPRLVYLYMYLCMYVLVYMYLYTNVMSLYMIMCIVYIHVFVFVLGASTDPLIVPRWHRDRVLITQ